MRQAALLTNIFLALMRVPVATVRLYLSILYTIFFQTGKSYA